MPAKAKKKGPTEAAAASEEIAEDQSKISRRRAPARAKPKSTAAPEEEIAIEQNVDNSRPEQNAASDLSGPQRQAKEAPKLRRKPQTERQDGFDALLEPNYRGKALTDAINTAEDKWNLLPAFLKVKGLVKQHIDSFNFFLEVELKKIIKANQMVRSDVDEKFFLRYLDIRVLEPNRQDEEGHGHHRSNITPNECRLRDMTYAAPIVVDIEYRRGNKKVTRKNIRIGRMPIMLRSRNCVLSGKSETELAGLGECSIDPGGYFIIRGQEKVILVQEQLSKNRVIVESAKGVIQASVTSSTHERKSKTYVLLKKGCLYLKHNILMEDIPVVFIMKALGVQSDYETLLLIAGEDSTYQDLFSVNFEACSREGIQTQQQALEYIGMRLRMPKKSFGAGQRRNHQQEAIECLSSVVITHVPVQGLNFRPKALYIAFMIRRVLMAMHDPSLVDDRDYVGNKRLELAGQMLSLLFEDHFKRFNNDFKMSIDKVLKKPNRTHEFEAFDHLGVHGNHITAGMERAMATGNWSLRRFKMERAGVTHLLSRLSYISALGMMTRITSQFEKTRKVSGPRALQPSQFGMLCPSDTPEGESCGLVKNLALMTHITTDDDEAPVRRMIFVLGAEDITSVSGIELYSEGAYAIFVNGTPVAITFQPKLFLNGFRKFRRMGRVSEFVSIFINHHHHAVHIATDEGRICRPLIVVERGRSKVTARYLKALLRGTMAFDDFLARGLVEYLDVNEENDSNIAVYEDQINENTTHLEIEPFTILGAVAGLIPFPHHNQSPRNTYQCAMGKQAIGAIAYNQFTRIDTLLYLMVYPQKPLVTTRAIELIKYDKLPAGQNAVVAVMSYSGYDIEDALVLNKASCDRGFGRCQVFKKVSTLMKTYANGSHDRINAAAKDPNNPRHAKLGADGLVEVGTTLAKDDVYILKQTPTHTSASGAGGIGGGGVGGPAPGAEYRDASMTYRLPDPCVVDKLMVAETEAGARLLKVQTRQTRRPELGDKFSSRHGQKGVVGLIAEQADLPFSDSGIVPDVIMNPHGFPSRMTVGKMLELLAGKAAVLAPPPRSSTSASSASTAFHGTAFARAHPAAHAADELLRRGFAYTGKDTLTSGVSGTPLPFYVFTGPIYYQKLKHMVQDKMHARARGPRAVLTRQPTEGRSREGGLRLGEMERDCLIAYGAAQLLRERLMLSSDAHECDVCAACGMMGFQGWCQTCGASAGVSRVTVPYAAKLLVQELLSMNVRAGLVLADEFPAEG